MTVVDTSPNDFFSIQIYTEEHTESVPKGHTFRLIQLQPLNWMDAWCSNGCLEYASESIFFPFHEVKDIATLTQLAAFVYLTCTNGSKIDHLIYS